MISYDIRGQALKELNIEEIREDVEVLHLSNNNLTEFPKDFFLKRRFVFEIECAQNFLRNISALQNIQCLSVLDLRYNNLKLVDLYPLRFCTIGELKLYGNTFQNDSNYRPLMVPAIIKNAWIVDGVFVTDHIRKMAKTLRESKNFYLEVRPKRKLTTGGDMTVVEKNIFDFCADLDFNSKPKKAFISPRGIGLIKFVDKPQSERLRFLGTRMNYDLKPGSFLDYFSLALGILCEQWLGEAVGTIPRYLSRGYWYTVQNEIISLENWMQTLVLVKIRDNIKPSTDIEKELWDALMVNRYLNTGKPPLPGSTSRLILTAFLARAIAQSDVTITNTDDLRIYFKYRKSCGFTTNDPGLEAVYNELIYPFAITTETIPSIGDKVSIAHPLTGEWNNGETKAIKNGRIFISVDDIIVQMPLSCLFWDGRGIWRENAKKDAFLSSSSGSKTNANAYTFLTQADAEGEQTLDVREELVEAQREVFQKPPPIQYKIAPENSVDFVKKEREIMRKSKFIDRTLKKSVTFRGIVDPPFHKVTPNSARRPPPASSVNHVVDNVVNVINGKEISEGVYLKKYQVKMVNQLTNKSKYVWINEEDVSPLDVMKLDEMYKKNFTEKMHTQSV